MTAPASLPRFLPYSEAHVTIPGDAAGVAEAEFGSHVLAVSDDGGRLLLDHPGSSDPAIRLQKGLEVRLTVDDGIKLWSFTSRIEAFEPAAPWGFWVLRPLDAAAYTPIQHRALLRVPMELPVELAVRQDGRSVAVRGQTVNLGGGGLGVRTPVALAEGQPVALRLQLLPDEPPLDLEARVIECRPVDAKAGAADAAFESRVAFQDIGEATRSQILRECYRVQIERRRSQLPLE
jgi:c-di-GMP-binding flagellar brake protein YcgR